MRRVCDVCKVLHNLLLIFGMHFNSSTTIYGPHILFICKLINSKIKKNGADGQSNSNLIDIHMVLLIQRFFSFEIRKLFLLNLNGSKLLLLICREHCHLRSNIQ